MSSLYKVKQQFVYIFTLNVDHDENLMPVFTLDTFYECLAAGKLDENFDPTGLDEFFPGLPESENAKQDVECLKMISLRERFNNSGFGVLKISSENQLDRDNLEAVINAKQREGNLKQFIDSCKMKGV